MSLRIELTTADATVALGRVLGDAVLRAGRTGHRLRHVLLFGDLGSGKTTLVRGFVKAFPGGTLAEVCSPSFTVCNRYPTMPPLLHADLYRDEDAAGFAAGFPDEAWDMLDSTDDGVVLTEWAQRLKERDRPAERLDVLLESDGGAHVAVLAPHGEAAAEVLDELTAQLSTRKGS